MSNGNMSNVEASFYTIVILIGIAGILSLFGVGANPKCARYDCDREVSNEGDYCFMHKYRYNTNKSYNSKTNSSSGTDSGSISSSTTSGSSYNSSSSSTTSGGSYNSSSSSTTSGNSYNSSSSSSSSKKPSSSSNKYNTLNSYDNGYDDVYMDDDFDWDRYREDDDYANGVDDAIEDMEEDGAW